MKINSVILRKGVAWALAALLLAVMHSGHAQSRFSASLTVAPSLTRVVHQDEADLITRNPYKQLGYQLGTQLYYHFSDQWSVSSGLWLEWNQIPSKYYDAVPGSLAFERSFHHNFQIPILLNYQTTTKRLAPYFSAGLVLHKAKYSYIVIRTTTGEETEHGSNFYSPILPRLLLGAGIKYRLNEHLSLITQPVIMYEVEKERGKRVFQYSLQTQLVCRF